MKARPGPKKPPRDRRHEAVEITSIGAGGEGVGRLADGRAVFVHRTAPGELVQINVVQDRPRWARGRLLELLRPAPARRAAPCPHYAECGGCTLEHLEYPAQLAIKGQIVVDAFERIGGLSIDRPEVVASPSQTRYRNRISVALRRVGNGLVYAGFHSLYDANRIVRIDGRCLLPVEPIAHVWDRLRAAWGPNASLLPSGETLRLTLRSTSETRVSLLIEGGYSRGRPEELLDQVDGLEAIWHRPDNKTVEHVAGAPGLPETWGEESFILRGTAFLQVNRGAASLLEDYVANLAGQLDGARVVDAYCGIGLLSRRLARTGAKVVGIESDEAATRIGASVACPGVTYRTGRVEEILLEELPAHLLVLNPPRAGVDPTVVDAILRAPPPRVIYVSCDPATLARDLKRLASVYTPRRIRCFDLFPQTAHVETVAELDLTR